MGPGFPFPSFSGKKGWLSSVCHPHHHPHRFDWCETCSYLSWGTKIVRRKRNVKVARPSPGWSLICAPASLLSRPLLLLGLLPSSWSCIPEHQICRIDSDGDDDDNDSDYDNNDDDDDDDDVADKSDGTSPGPGCVTQKSEQGFLDTFGKDCKV